MISQRLREMLKKPMPQRQRMKDLSSPCTLIVGRRMVVNGCESSVCLASRIPEERRQKRVVLNSIGPGDVLRAPARFFDSIVHQRRLPRLAHCRLWDGGKRHTGYAWTRPRSPPCPHHADGQTCSRCPWMGLAETVSREIKAEHLRRVIEPLFLSEETLSVSHGNEAGSKSISLLSSLRFLEPFDVPITSHAMREVEFHFRRSSQEEGASGGCTSTAASVEAGGKFCFSNNSSGTPECLLCTLEQQRLLLFMNRWAERLPLPVQQCLRTVFILQHPSHDTVAHPWERAIHLTLLLRKDAVCFGEQNPLCGPSQPEELLSRQEQDLVDAVLSAAPLTKHIGVATVCNDGSASFLYPRLRRADFSTAPSVLWTELLPCTAVQHTSGKVVTAKLPFMHSSIAFALGAQDMTALEFSSPSVWRLTMALEAVGSVLLSMIDGLQGDGALVVLAESACYESSGAAFPRRSGSYLLAKVLSEWFDQAVSSSSLSKRPVVHITSKEQVDLGVLSQGEGGTNFPALWVCVVGADACVGAAAAASATIVSHVIESIRQGVSMTRRRIVFVQLSADGDFQPLARALKGVKTGLGQHLQLYLDSGIVDIDPWTAAALGYVVMELLEPVIS